MSEDSPSRVPEPTTPIAPDAPETSEAQPDQAPGVTPVKRRGLPRWLPLLLLAVVPAVIVGVGVALLAGGGSGEKDRSAAVVDGFVHSNGPSDSVVTSYKAVTPPGFPKDFPAYGGAKIVSSFLVASDEGRHYFVVLSAKADPSKVYDYYLGVLDKDPWQVSVATAGNEFTGLRFTNPGNADVQGEVAIFKSDLDDLTNIYVTYQDESAEAKKADKPEPKFVLGPSYALPPGFPTEVPLYNKGGDPAIIETYFERSSGMTEYSVSFLTKSSQGDVIKSYEDELSKKGWDTRQPKTPSSSFSLGLAFSDNKQIDGTVQVDTFEKDDKYQKVDIYVSVSKAGSGGGSAAPSTAPTPRAGATPSTAATPGTPPTPRPGN